MPHCDGGVASQRLQHQDRWKDAARLDMIDHFQDLVGGGMIGFRKTVIRSHAQVIWVEVEVLEQVRACRLWMSYRLKAIRPRLTNKVLKNLCP